MPQLRLRSGSAFSTGAEKSKPRLLIAGSNEPQAIPTTIASGRPSSIVRNKWLAARMGIPQLCAEKLL
jgi:hypothetical protein